MHVCVSVRVRWARALAGLRAVLVTGLVLLASDAVRALTCSASAGAPSGLITGVSGPAGLGVLGALAGLTGPAAPSGPGAAVCQPGEPASLASVSPGTLAGNPFDVITGVKHERVVDVFVPTRAPATADPLDFVFARLYSSARTVPGTFGPGWSHSFETRLVPAVPAGAVLHQADGRVLAFARPTPLQQGGTRFRPHVHADGVLDRISEGVAARWVWRWRNGRQLVFDADGRLMRIVSLDRDAIALEHDDAGRLVRVHDNRGRSARLEYRGDPSRIARLVLDDGRVLRYRYDDDGRLVHVHAHAQPGVQADVRADTNDRPRADTSSLPLTGADEAVQYRYEDARGVHRLTGIVAADGTRTTYAYDASGRVVASHGRGSVGGSELRARYVVPSMRGGTGRTEVTDAASPGRTAVYRWVVPVGGGTARLLGAHGTPCTACPPVGRRYRYDAQGALVAMETAAGSIEIRRDDRGRPRALLGREIARPIDIEWVDDPVLDLPRVVRRASVVTGRWHERRFRYSPQGQPIEIEERGWTPVAFADVGEDARAAQREGAAGVQMHRRITIEHVAEGAAGGRIAAIDGPLEGHADRLVLRHDATRALVAVAPQVGTVSSAAGSALRADELPRLAAEAGARGIEHDARAGRVVVHAAPGERFEFGLDDFDRVVDLRSPDGARVLRAHDAADRIVTERDAMARVAHYRFDARGAPIEHRIEAPGEPAVITRYRYDANRLVSIVHPAQHERFTHDARGRLTSTRIAITLAGGAQASFALDRVYEGADTQPYARTLPDGSTLWLETDARGAVTGLLRSAAWLPGGQRIAAGIAYDHRGVSALTFGNRSQLRIARDASGRIEALEHRAVLRAGASTAEPLFHQRVVRDAAGRSIAVQDAQRVWRLYRDRHARLIQVVESETDVRDPAARVWRFHHDAAGHRRLAQQAEPDDPAAAGTVATRFVPGAALPAAQVKADEVNEAAVRLDFDASGRQRAAPGRRFTWDAAGLLARVDLDDGRAVAYRYNHRGERILTRAPDGDTYHLFEDRRPIAELDASGRVVRMYLYLHDLPIAVVDAAPSGNAGSGGRGRERLRFLHLDHRAAPVVATDEVGTVVWRAAHAPYGRRIAAPVADGAFDIPLRLPGQYEDRVSGLHYNGHRHYDPDSGRYLSPDPLGLRGGLSTHAYGGGDPMRWFDPDGLLLFAFDGTENSDPPPRRDDWSNVYKLARTYADGRVWYVNGVGRADTGAQVQGGAPDAILASSARARVEFMLGELERHVSAAPDARAWTEIDVIGFSRGAAMARDFANRVAERVRTGVFARMQACVRLRFLGVWDTVAQFGLNGLGNLAWSLAVPAEVAYAAHAVALNEHRTLFPAESILGGSGGARIERGFVGAHSDVGGGYAEGDLSDVALAWMHAQAGAAGVRMVTLPERFLLVSDPLLHDSSMVSVGDREVRYRNASGWTYANPFQRAAPIPGLRWRDTAQFIARFPDPQPDTYGENSLVGRVDMARYGQWLTANYGLAMAAP